MLRKLRTLISFYEANGIVRTTKLIMRYIQNLLFDHPQRMSIVTTSICNIDCIMCSLHDCYPPKNADETMLQFMTKLNGTSFQLGVIAEPLAHSRVYEVIKRLKDRGAQVTFSTNGTLLNNNVAKKLIDLKVDSIQVSLDGISEIYERIRKGAKFSEVIANVRNLQMEKRAAKSQKPYITSLFIAMKSNYKCLPDVIKLAAELDMKHVGVSNIEPYSEEMAEESLLIHKELHPKVREVFDEAIKLAKLANIDLVLPRLEPDSAHCPFLFPVVTPEGDVVPCCELCYDRPVFLAVEDGQVINKKIWFRKKSFGNIREKALTEIYKGKEYLTFRRNVNNGIFPGVCANCLCKYGIICPS